jgi:hypothetical protein
MGEDQFVILYFDKGGTMIYDTSQDPDVILPLYPSPDSIRETYLPDRLKGYVSYARVEKRIYF